MKEQNRLPNLVWKRPAGKTGGRKDKSGMCDAKKGA